MIRANLKVLLEGGFAFGKKRLDVHAPLTQSSPLGLLAYLSPIDARLLPVAAKQRAERQPLRSNSRTR